MSMLDSFKYEQRWWVHEEDDSFYDGEEYESLSDAEAAAIDEAEHRSDDYVFVVTEVLTKQIKKTAVERKITLEDV